MTRAGLPVPPGLVVTTEACNAFFDNDKNFPEGMWEQVKDGLRGIEEKVGKKFGDPKNPLLVSVRSGAAFSMPGMMDTVLNLGLNEENSARAWRNRRAICVSRSMLIDGLHRCLARS
jgi:pyruvate,orthophosphate dikinase